MRDQAIINSFDHPTSNGEIVKRIAVSSSIDGYKGEMDVLQFLHFPFWKRNDAIGINSNCVSFLLQAGHADPGYEID
jgi:hypothetical protein